MYVDASNEAVGAALHQNINGDLQPLGFYSKKLTSAQRNYSTYDRELTAIYQGILHFKHLVEGRDCYVVTDHRPLIFAYKQKTQPTSQRRANQLDFISQFTTDFRHIAGSKNVTADLLSRISEIEKRVDFEEIAIAQKDDEELKLFIQKQGEKTVSIQLKPLLIPGSTIHTGSVQTYCDANCPQSFSPWR